MALADNDGIVQIYTTGVEGLLQIAESRVTHQPTAQKKEKYELMDWWNVR